MENQEEIWKDVVGYEGVYKVSSCGKLKRIYKTKKDAILQCFTNENGYTCTRIRINGGGKNIRVHRLVCIAFLDNPLNKPHVNHKNGLMDNKNGEKDLIINYKKFIKNGRIDYVELRKTIVHEIQHFAQRQEGFGAGSNYKRAEKQIQEDRARILEKERTSGLTPLENVEKDFLNNETSE